MVEDVAEFHFSSFYDWSNPMNKVMADLAERGYKIKFSGSKIVESSIFKITPQSFRGFIEKGIDVADLYIKALYDASKDLEGEGRKKIEHGLRKAHEELYDLFGDEGKKRLSDFDEIYRKTLHPEPNLQDAASESATDNAPKTSCCMPIASLVRRMCRFFTRQVGR